MTEAEEDIVARDYRNGCMKKKGGEKQLKQGRDC